MTDYPYVGTKNDIARQVQMSPPIGKVRVLEDIDGDGVYDKSDILATDLSWPTGIALYNGGAFVSATPDIWYLKDTDGDGKADIREKVFTGFRKFNVQDVINTLLWGLDNKVYGAGASNNGQIKSSRNPSAPTITLGQNDFWFDPETLDFQVVSGGAHFGASFDDWGNRFLCHIRNPAQHVVLPARYLARNPNLPVPKAVFDIAEAGDQLPVYRTSPVEPWRALRARRFALQRDRPHPRSEIVGEGYVTSSSGVTVYRGAAYPSEYYNNIFVADVAANLVHRKTLTPDGVTFSAKRADQNVEFLTSEDIWFRPVNFLNAPDGTLHVVDMYRETIEHPWSIPDDIKAKLDLESGRDRGRIYRLSPPGFKVPKQPRLGKATTAELVQTLDSLNSWWRETAHRLIFERKDQAAVVPLKELLRKSKSPLGRLHAMWSLLGLKGLSDDDVLIGLGDSSPGVRENAVRLAESRLKASRPLLEKVAALASDPEIRVRFQVAFSLGEVQDPLAADGLLKIARRDSADQWVRVAVLSSLAESSDSVLLGLLKDPSFASDAANGLPFGRQLAVVVGRRDRAEEVSRVVAGLVAMPDGPQSRVIQTNALLGLGEGLSRARKSLSSLASNADSPAAKLINAVQSDAAAAVKDGSLSTAARKNAVEMLSYGTYQQAKPALVSLFDAKQPTELQLAAVRSLASFPDAEVATTLLGQWKAYTPAVRSEIVEQLLSRPERNMPLVDAIAAGVVSSTLINPQARVRLWNNRNQEIQAKARKVFAGDMPSPRKDVIAQYQAALSLKGERLKGKAVFERECVACHRLDEKGNDIGPSLTTIRHRTPDDVMMHILDPNREVAQGFVQYVVSTDDGRSLTGIIAEETATSITLKRAENVTESILRKNIEEISNTGISLMPEGLEKKIQLQEMADLLMYLLGPK
jgi:putative membrane-bound dehydrogenase-like protein